jgi:predicted lipoprotein with Yx(FWY)xxD motif
MKPILLTLAALAALSVLALAGAPPGQALEYPYPYPEEAPSAPAPPKPPTGGTARVVKQTRNKQLGRKVLTNDRGRTLYSLSAERNGRFICDESACLSLWKPLTVPAGVRPIGPVPLGTIVRPDGRTQVTFRGLPLYRFSGDTRRGDAAGEGIRDVGVWHAAGGKR